LRNRDLVIRTSADPAWHPLLSRYEPYFHQRPDWFQHLETAFRGEGIALCLEEKAGPIACLPAFLMRAPPFRVLFAGIPYGDVLGPAGIEDDFFSVVKRDRKAVPADQLRYVPFARGGPLPSSFDRFEERVITELRLSGGTADGLYERMPRPVRKALRKSKRLGLSAEHCSGEDCGAMLHGFYADTMRRNGAPCRYPQAWFRSLASATHPTPKIESLLATGADGPVAMAVTATGHGVLHVLHGACGARGLSSGAAELLDFTAISRAVSAGVRRVDFGASDPDDDGLRAYKRKFGGEERVATVGVMHLRPLRSRLADLARTIAGTRIGGGLLVPTRIERTDRGPESGPS